MGCDTELTEDGVVRLGRGRSRGHERPRARGSHDGGLLDTEETVDVVRTSILSWGSEGMRLEMN